MTTGALLSKPAATAEIKPDSAIRLHLGILDRREMAARVASAISTTSFAAG